MQIIARDGTTVHRWADWPRPKEEYQWRAGRSAMELARAWLPAGEVTIPLEIQSLLDSHEMTRGLVVAEGWPEFKTELPERGEGRNHDLLLRAQKEGERVTIGIEAKTDETLGEYIGAHIACATRKNAKSRVPRRTERVLEYLFNTLCDPTREPFAGLRYQVVIAAAATAFQALQDRSRLAVFILHELRTWKCDEEKLGRNDSDFADFINVMTGVPKRNVQAGALYGPVILSSTAYARTPMPLLMGKAVSSRIEDWERPVSVR